MLSSVSNGKFTGPHQIFVRCFHPGLVAHRVWRFSPELNCRPKIEACHFNMSIPKEWSLYFSIQIPNHEAEWSSSIALPFGRTVDPAMDCTLKPIKGGLQLDHAETFSVFALKESAHPMPWCSGCSGRNANSRDDIFKEFQRHDMGAKKMGNLEIHLKLTKL